MPVSYSGTAITWPDSSTTTSGWTGFKNRIINGAMMIDQRNAGASVTLSAATGQYCLDRYYYNASQASKLTVQQSSTVPTGFAKSMVVTVASAATIGSGDYFTCNQVIEANNLSDLGFGTANAKTVTLSFWVRSSVTGTFVVALLNGTLDRNYLATYTISAANTWEQKSITIAGDTTGTWATSGTSGGLQLRFDLGSGSSGMGTANTWQAGNLWSISGSASSTFAAQSGATWYITGVQLERGSTASSFEYRPYGTELALCQRYYQCIGGAFNGSPSSQNYGIGQVYNATYSDTVVTFPVVMRTSPTFNCLNPTNIQIIQGTSFINVTAASLDASSPTHFAVSFTASGLTGGYAVRYQQNAANVSQMQFSAEL